MINRPLAKDERISLIADIFSDRDETEAVKCLSGDDAQSFVDAIDEVLPHPHPRRIGLLTWTKLSDNEQMLDSLASRLRGKCLAILCRICGQQALLPRSVQVPLCYDRTDAPLYHGGFAEVWRGEHQGNEVAVKVIKVYKTSNLAKITRVDFQSFEELALTS